MSGLHDERMDVDMDDDELGGSAGSGPTDGHDSPKTIRTEDARNDSRVDRLLGERQGVTDLNTLKLASGDQQELANGDDRRSELTVRGHDGNGGLDFENPHTHRHTHHDDGHDVAQRRSAATASATTRSTSADSPSLFDGSDHTPLGTPQHISNFNSPIPSSAAIPLDELLFPAQPRSAASRARPRPLQSITSPKPYAYSPPTASTGRSWSARSRPSPYPSLSALSARSMSRGPAPGTPRPPSAAASNPHTPSPPPAGAAGASGSASSPNLASPKGSMSMSKRRAPPAWPSPRNPHIHPHSRGSHGAHTSHRELIARAAAAAFSPTDYSRTPAALRVPLTPAYSPAFYRSGYSRYQHPYGLVAPSPGLPSAGMRPRMSNSAPMASSPRLPDELRPPSPPVPPLPGKMTTTERGTVQYKNVSTHWVVRELNMNAAHVWWSPETTDCRIIVPIWSILAKRTEARSTAQQPPDSGASVHSNQPGRSYWPPTPVGPVQAGELSKGIAEGKEDVVSAHHVQRGSRRGSLPERDDIPVIVFPLHQDYLITQSKFFRMLLASAPAHLDMPLPKDGRAESSSPRSGSHRTAVRAGEGSPTSPADGSFKGAKVMPTASGEPPALYIPVPDPGSFGILLHWLYWGENAAVENALSRGLVSWQGIVHNIDYLDLDDNIKRVVGRWWRKWVKTESQAGVNAASGSRAGRSNAGPSDEWFDGDEEEEKRSHVNGLKEESDGEDADVEDAVKAGDGMEVEGEDSPPLPDEKDHRGNGGDEDTRATVTAGRSTSAATKAKRWMRSDGDLDEGMVGQLRDL